MGIHEISIGNVYISPILIYTLLALPITYGAIRLMSYFKLSRFVWHEMLFIIALYIIIFSLITLLSPF
ncbi:DUF1656 domain-containing protein [Wohlfahrtiimonas larvae]|uniref:DUF1656 domain-containing protein n=1 Tax=Wohlfahrtiimonas larvae TaxID=1157986 RepID=A0ABP9MFG4_9GAMM